MADLRAQIEIELIDKASAKASSIARATDRLRETQLKAAQAASRVAQQDLVAARAAVERAQSTGEGAQAVALLERAQAKEARAAQRVAAAELRAAKAARRLAQDTRGAASASKAHAAAEQVEAAATRAVGAAETNTRAARAQSGRALAEKVNLASELTLGFGALNPKIMQVGLSFASAGNNAFALGAALGPIGVIGGVLLSVVPAMAAAFGDAGDEAEEAEEQLSDVEKRLTSMERQAIDTAEALRQVAEGIARAREEARFAERLDRGEGSADEQEAFTRQAQQEREQLLEQIQSAEAAQARIDLVPEGLRNEAVEQAAARVQSTIDQARGRLGELGDEVRRRAALQAEASFRESEAAVEEKRKGAVEGRQAKLGDFLEETNRGGGRGGRADVTEIVRALNEDPTQRRVEGAIDIRINGRPAGQLPVSGGGGQSTALVDVASVDPEAAGGLSS